MANEITEFYGRSKIDEKFLAKPSGGSAGQFLKKTADGSAWGDVPPGVTLDTSMPATEPAEDNGHGLTLKAIWTWVMGKLSGYVPSTRKVNGNPLSADVTIAIPTKVSDLTDGSEYAKSSDVVAKEDGKGLSTNDFTDDDKTDLAEAKEHAESEGNPHNTTIGDIYNLDQRLVAAESDASTGKSHAEESGNPHGTAASDIDDFDSSVVGAMSAEGISSSGINIGGSISGDSISDQYGNLRDAIGEKLDSSNGSGEIRWNDGDLELNAKTYVRDIRGADLDSFLIDDNSEGGRPIQAAIAAGITGDEEVTELSGVKSALFADADFSKACDYVVGSGENPTDRTVLDLGTLTAAKTLTIAAPRGDGKLRDFAVTFTEPDTAVAVKFSTTDAGGNALTFYGGFIVPTASKKHIYYLTEIAANVFLVKGEVIEAATQE